MTTVTTEVSMPNVEEIQRVIDEWFDAQPLSTAYAAIQGDDEANAATGDYSELDEHEQRRVMMTAFRYMWLSAVRKRLRRTD
jgi:hypothetical protein